MPRAMRTDGGGSLCPTNAGAHLRFGGLRDAIEQSSIEPLFLFFLEGGIVQRLQVYLGHGYGGPMLRLRLSHWL